MLQQQHIRYTTESIFITP